jgi:hypothetical protein
MTQVTPGAKPKEVLREVATAPVSREEFSFLAARVEALEALVPPPLDPIEESTQRIEQAKARRKR